MKRRHPDEYIQIRIMLRERAPHMDTVNPHVRVMGQDVYLDLWTYCDVATLRATRGERWWSMLWEDMLGAPAWEIWGRVEGGDWEPLSGWLLDELQREEWRGRAFRGEAGSEAARESVSPGATARNVAPRVKPGRRRGSGVDTLVWHLREKANIKGYDEVYAVLREAGLERVDVVTGAWDQNWRERLWWAYSRAKRAHGSKCECADDGLPAQVREAISRLKLG